MVRGKAEDAGGLTPAKGGSAALCHFGHRTLPIFKCVGYIAQNSAAFQKTAKSPPPLPERKNYRVLSVPGNRDLRPHPPGGAFHRPALPEPVR